MPLQIAASDIWSTPTVKYLFTTGDCCWLVLRPTRKNSRNYIPFPAFYDDHNWQWRQTTNLLRSSWKTQIQLHNLPPQRSLRDRDAVPSIFAGWFFTERNPSKKLVLFYALEPADGWWTNSVFSTGFVRMERISGLQFYRLLRTQVDDQRDATIPLVTCIREKRLKPKLGSFCTVYWSYSLRFNGITFNQFQ